MMSLVLNMLFWVERLKLNDYLRVFSMELKLWEYLGLFKDMMESERES